MGCQSCFSHAFGLHISDMCSGESAGFDSFDACVFDTGTVLQLDSDTAKCLSDHDVLALAHINSGLASTCCYAGVTCSHSGLTTYRILY